MSTSRSKNLVGRIYGRLTVVAQSENVTTTDGITRSTWECLCECGNTTVKIGTELNKNRTKSCGCLRTESRYRLRNNDLSVSNRSENRLYKDYIDSAKRRGHTFNITNAEFIELINSSCFYCGEKPRDVRKKRGGTEYIGKFNGVDRFDNSIGYEIENCKPCCKTCNRMKQVYHGNDFIDHMKKIFKHSSK